MARSFVEDLSPANIAASAKGFTCPACGQPKARQETFCRECHAHLPESLRERLARAKVEGVGVDTAIAACFRQLEVNEWHHPDPKHSEFNWKKEVSKHGT